jgi:hypothetical protein
MRMYHMFNRHAGFEDAMLIHKDAAPPVAFVRSCLRQSAPLVFVSLVFLLITNASPHRYATRAEAEHARAQMQE